MGVKSITIISKRDGCSKVYKNEEALLNETVITFSDGHSTDLRTVLRNLMNYNSVKDYQDKYYNEAQVKICALKELENAYKKLMPNSCLADLSFEDWEVLLTQKQGIKEKE